jgi:acyl-CoA thioesterase FadM
MKPKTAEQLHTALDGRLDGYLRTDEAFRALWSTDASIYLRKPVGVVARTMVPEGEAVSTVELNLSYLRPANAGMIWAEARIVKCGKRLVVGTADVKDDSERLCAAGRASYVVIG